MKRFEGYLKGINLGGWFSQCDYSEETYNHFIEEKDFEVIKSWGLDHVRIPVDYNLVATDADELLEEGFTRLENAFLWAKKNGLNAILDLHKTFGYSFDKMEGEVGFFEDEALQQRFYDLWAEFARRYYKYHDFLAFELLNEIDDISRKDVWNKIATKCIKVIREIAPDVKILVGGYYHNSVTAVKDIDVDFDENIVINFHCYEPLLFTHQAAYWIPGMSPDFRWPYRSTFNEYQQHDDMINEGSRYIIRMQNPESTPTSAFFKQLFAEAIAVAEKRDLPLYCGEYGVIELADVEQLKEWYLDIHAVFDKYGIGRALWTYRGKDFDFCNGRLDGVRKEIL